MFQYLEKIPKSFHVKPCIRDLTQNMKLVMYNFLGRVWSILRNARAILQVITWNSMSLISVVYDIT